ncbi:hypothetical protein HYQ46_011450 [Verticillium longisporum]|nr:hypothetical protein HYQ46_011450 [Verticillium longisporum]
MAESHEARLQGLEASSTDAQAVAKNTEDSLALGRLGTRLQDQINGHGARLDSLEERRIHNTMSEEDAKRIETLEQRNRDLEEQLNDLRAQSSLSDAPSTAQFNALQDQVSALARRMAESDSRAQTESAHVKEAELTRQTQAELIETQSQHIAKLQQQIESNQRVIDLEPEFETVKSQLTEVQAAVEGKDFLVRQAANLATPVPIALATPAPRHLEPDDAVHDAIGGPAANCRAEPRPARALAVAPEPAASLLALGLRRHGRKLALLGRVAVDAHDVVKDAALARLHGLRRQMRERAWQKRTWRGWAAGRG